MPREESQKKRAKWERDKTLAIIKPGEKQKEEMLSGLNTRIKLSKDADGNVKYIKQTKGEDGTWIDGKPIYRKMYEFSNISPNETKNTALGIDNLYRIVNWSGSVETSGTARSCFVSGIVPFVHYQLGNIYVSNTGSETINSISVIIEYTKTND